jgi:hypothetical protein
MTKVGWSAAEHHDSHNRNRGLFGFEVIFVNLQSTIVVFCLFVVVKHKAGGSKLAWDFRYLPS